MSEASGSGPRNQGSFRRQEPGLRRATIPPRCELNVHTLDKVVPWGRSFDEYSQMFAPTEEDLRSRILDCGGGPASFNAVATRRGAHVISCDPLYGFETSQIRQRIAATYQAILEETRRNQEKFLWDSIRSVDELGDVRMAAMTDFLADYSEGKAHGRYVDAQLPTLPSSDACFDLALCSHLLFLYTTQLGLAFHQSAIREMCRVAAEVRIFPLMMLDASRSPYVDPVQSEFSEAGYCVSIEQVPYEFQRGGNEMMRIRGMT